MSEINEIEQSEAVQEVPAEDAPVEDDGEELNETAQDNAGGGGQQS